MKERSSNGISCEFFEENLSDLLEGHLTPALRDELNTHLGVCGECRELRDLVAETVFACRSLSADVTPSSRLESGLIAIMQDTISIDCRYFEQSLSDLIEDSLADAARAGLLSHKDGCGECRSLFEITSTSLSEINALAKSPVPIRRNLLERLLEIPVMETRLRIPSFLRAGLRGMADLLEGLTSSPVLTQTAGIVLLVASAALFLGAPSATDERSAPTLTKGYDMVVKTYSDGSDAILKAIDAGAGEPNGGGKK